MSDDSIQALHPPVGGAAGVLDALENWLGWFFGILLVLMFGGLLALITQDLWERQSWLERSGWILAGGTWLVLDVPYAWRLAVAALRGRRPFALQAAVNQKMPPALLRPVVGLWWLAHFVAGVAGAAFTHYLKTPEEPRMGGIVTFFMVACYGYAANGFLMLAVCAVTSSERVRAVAWRARTLTDIGLACLSLGLWR